MPIPIPSASSIELHPAVGIIARPATPAALRRLFELPAKLTCGLLFNYGLALIWAILGFAPQNALAGLTPSEVVVVVNGTSLNSRTLANHYVALRQIPARNVIVLEDVPNSEVIKVGEFRERILKPIIQQLIDRQLIGHVQCISYSADFPTGIDIAEDLKALGELPTVYTKRASINGLTYMFTKTLKADPNYIYLENNFYARRAIETYFTNPAGELTQAAWTSIQNHIAASEHSEASAELEQLYASHPNQFPLLYLAAAEAAQSDSPESAIPLLERAIDKGWNAGGYLKNDNRFDAIRSNADFETLELLLDDTIQDWQPTIGFDFNTAWSPNGVPEDKAELGQLYYLSTVLGVTRGAGTSLPDAIASLQRAASADATYPRGSFYFCLTGDVRTKTREPGFDRTIAQLRQLGYGAEIVKAALPKDKPAVLGVQFGTASFNWESCGSKLVPGAIADNLTSHGGMMAQTNGQTKLSRLIEAGAAGSSGTVIEPYALQAKFPHPQMYLHYARGVSLAEAFYLSVTGPYQLLIVGDPICQPFSHRPTTPETEGLRRMESGENLMLSIDVGGPSYLEWMGSPGQYADRRTRLKPTTLGILFDGANYRLGAARKNLSLSITGHPEGYHEVTVKLLVDDPLRTKSEFMTPLWLGKENLLTLEVSDTNSTESGPEVSLQNEKIVLSADATILAQDLSGGAQISKVTFWHDSELLGVQTDFAAATDSGNTQAQLEVQLARLGMGPVRLQAKAELSTGEVIASQPLQLNVAP